MKRLREDKHEYLGGDLVDGNDDEASDSTAPASKADRNLARKLANKRWKLVDRKVGSGVDPSPRHSQYYKAQLADLSDPLEWEQFQASLVQPLPVSFRFGGGCPNAVRKGLTKQFETTFKTMKGRFVEINGVVLHENIVKKISWPGEGVYQVAADSLTLSKNEGLEPLSTVLRREVKLGHVVRQELASMIPALLLQVEQQHNVLDLCAAPGSKTEQLLTLMEQHAALHCKDGMTPRATGMVVANDPDPDRIRTLKTRYDKCLSPNFLITCATAEDLAKQIGDNGPVFDRILADVPCSGDGTIRKFPHIWRLFRPRMAIELHSIQLQIALSGVAMLRPGGRFVYSTCSINPIEDEAVVAGLLRHHWGDGLRLVDTRAAGLLPLLSSRPGISTWRCDKDIFVAGEAEGTRLETLRRLPVLVDTLHPPSAEEAELFQLNRCHRILPHDNDTGGFFVAVLELCSNATVGDGTIPAAVSVVDGPQSVGVLSKSKKGKDAVDVMKQLGYNPKRISKKQKPPSASQRDKDKRSKSRGEKGTQGTEDGGTAVEASYSVCDDNQVERISSWLGMNLPSSTSATGEHLIVSNDLVQSAEEISIVSANVMQALNTWAAPGFHGGPSDGYCLIHAGAPVAYNCTPRRSEHDRGSWGMRMGLSITDHSDQYMLAPYGARVLRPLLPQLNICDLSAHDFISLASLRLFEDADDGVTFKLTALFDSSGDASTDGSDDGLPVISAHGNQSLISLLQGILASVDHVTTASTVTHIFVTHGRSVVGVDARDGHDTGRGDNRQKKRLSKAERKKMKQGHVEPQHNTVDVYAEQVAISTENRSEETCALDLDAILIIRCELPSLHSGTTAGAMDGSRAEVLLSDARFSFVTALDTCQSYVDSISTSPH